MLVERSNFTVTRMVRLLGVFRSGFYAWLIRVPSQRAIRRQAGLLSKEWSAGCLNGDNPDDGFESAKWIGPESVAARVTDGRVLRVDLDPATGRPFRPVVTGAGC